MGWRAVAGLLVLSLAAACAHRVEEPAYRVIKQVGDAIELRVYGAALQAEVQVSGDRNDTAYEAFRILVAYIKGDNSQQKSIEMTAPCGTATDKQGYVAGCLLHA